MTTRNQFVGQGPVDKGGDILFEPQKALYRRLESVADHIASAAGHQDVESMTFAVTGPWGAGKSSALHVLRDMVDDRMGADSPLTVSWYDSPLYQRLSFPARTTLAFEVIRGLDLPDESLGATPSMVDQLHQVLGDGTEPPDGGEGEARSFVHARLLQNLLTKLGDAPLLLEPWTARLSSRPAGAVHLVLIDDLDRCSRQFASEVLAATNNWARVPSLFFVIAASKDHLIESVAEQMELKERYVGEALEKYVHFTVEIPPAPASQGEAAVMFRALIEVLALDEDERKSITDLVDLAGHEHSLAVLSPAFRPDDRPTPRAFKQRFNTLIPEILALGQVTPSSVKPIVLKVMWPDFYRDHFEPAAMREDQRELKWLQQLLRLGRQARAAADDELRVAEFRVEVGADREEVDLKGASPYLVLYLAAEPAIQLGDPRDDNWPPDGPGVPSFSFNPTGALGPTATSDTDVTALSGDRSVEIVSLATQLDFAAEKEDTATGQDLAARLLAIEESNPVLKTSNAPTVGNAALRLERLKLIPQAVRMHRWAMRIDPNHTNVLQNFVDCVLDWEVQTLYDEARVVLHEIEHAERHLAWRPFRTRLLRLRLEVAEDATSDQDGTLTTEIDELIRYTTASGLRSESDWTLGEVMDLLRSLQRLSRYESVRDLAQGLLPNLEPDSPQVAYSILRVVGDILAGSSDPTDENEAIDIFRYLMSSGLACAEERNVGDVMYNLAVLLRLRSYKDTAGRLQARAYELSPNDQNIRVGLSRYIFDTTKDAELAEAIMLGKDIAIDLASIGQWEALPASFTSSEPWWKGWPGSGGYDNPCIPELVTGA